MKLRPWLPSSPPQSIHLDHRSCLSPSWVDLSTLHLLMVVTEVLDSSVTSGNNHFEFQGGNLIHKSIVCKEGARLSFVMYMVT